MRLLAPFSLLLSAASLIPSVFAAPDPVAAKKLSKFSALASGPKSKNGMLQLTDNLYDELTTGPRDYYAVVLLTALDPRIGCQLCREFQPEYDLLAKSWNRKHKNGDGLFFAEMDFANARATFQKVCPLHLRSNWSSVQC